MDLAKKDESTAEKPKVITPEVKFISNINKVFMRKRKS